MPEETLSSVLNPALATGKDGFPDAPDTWTPEGAAAVAQREGLAWNDETKELIRALQEYFARNEHVHIRDLHDALDEHFHSRGGLRHLYERFPGGPVAQGCRLAGLTAPAGSTDPSFGSVQ